MHKLLILIFFSILAMGSVTLASEEWTGTAPNVRMGRRVAKNHPDKLRDIQAEVARWTGSPAALLKHLTENIDTLGGDDAGHEGGGGGAEGVAAPLTPPEWWKSVFDHLIGTEAEYKAFSDALNAPFWEGLVPTVNTASDATIWRPVVETAVELTAELSKEYGAQVADLSAATVRTWISDLATSIDRAQRGGFARTVPGGVIIPDEVIRVLNWFRDHLAFTTLADPETAYPDTPLNERLLKHSQQKTKELWTTVWNRSLPNALTSLMKKEIFSGLRASGIPGAPDFIPAQVSLIQTVLEDTFGPARALVKVGDKHSNGKDMIPGLWAYLVKK